jgi:uncharacterized protein YndB with AHSA1/START domain
MLNPFENVDTALQVRRTFSVSRQKAFAAWTTADILMEWFDPGGNPMTGVEVDLRVGGRFRLTAADPDGNPIHMVGEYQEISPPSKLVFTWSFETADGSIAFPYSTVRLDFLEAPDGTEIVLTHTGLPSKDSRDGHRAGWMIGFNQFETYTGGENSA